MPATKQLFEERRETTTSRKLREVEATSSATKAAKATACLIKLLSLSPTLAILIVFSTLLGVANHVVSLSQRLELSLSLRIVGMQIGVKLLGALQVGLLHILLRYRLIDA